MRKDYFCEAQAQRLSPMTENVISTLRSSLSRGSLSNAPWYSTPSSVVV